MTQIRMHAGAAPARGPSVTVTKKYTVYRVSGTCKGRVDKEHAKHVKSINGATETTRSLHSPLDKLFALSLMHYWFMTHAGAAPTRA